MTANFVSSPRMHSENVYGVSFLFKDLVEDGCPIKTDPTKVTVRELVEHAEFYMDTANDKTGTKVDHIHLAVGELTQEEDGPHFCSETWHIDMYFVEKDNLWDLPFSQVVEKLCYELDGAIIGDASFDQYHGN